MRPTLTAAAAILAATPALADPPEEQPFSVAKVLAELNATDGDLGFHAVVDGEPWRELAIYDPDESRILRLRNTGALRDQGLTELAFESAEPEFDELSPEEFFERFREGVYEIAGVGVEGAAMESEAVFTHVLPAPAVILAPGEADCDAPILLPPGDVAVAWTAVTGAHPWIGRDAPGFAIARYQVAVGQEDGGDFAAEFDLDPSTLAVTLPAALLAPGGVYKVEILAEELSGNRTAVESCFEIVS